MSHNDAICKSSKNEKMQKKPPPKRGQRLLDTLESTQFIRQPSRTVAKNIAYLDRIPFTKDTIPKPKIIAATTVRQEGSRWRIVLTICHISKAVTHIITKTSNNIILQCLLGSLRANRLITTIRRAQPTLIRMCPSLSGTGLRIIHDNLSRLGFDTRRRCSVSLSSYYTTITSK